MIGYTEDERRNEFVRIPVAKERYNMNFIRYPLNEIPWFTPYRKQCPSYVLFINSLRLSDAYMRR